MIKSKSISVLMFAFIIYSIALYLSKIASAQDERILFLFYYCLALSCIGIYAIFWQLALKEIPLNVAYPLKSITMVINLFLGVVFLKETITISKIIGVAIIIIGVFLVGGSHE